MENFKTLLEQITQVASNIETNYPELYVFLDEEPMTIPVTKALWTII